MKKKSGCYFLLTAIICLVLGLNTSSVAYAEGVEQVETKVGVGFYEASTDSSTQESVDSSGSLKKPKGKYPSTGEVVKKSLTVSGAFLVILALYFILRKTRKTPIKDGRER